jgi:molybdopterin/thiamine biosynthesis adenylyltransferase
MLDAIEIEMLLSGLKGFSFTRIDPSNDSLSKRRNLISVFESEITIEGKDVVLAIGFDDRFPYSKPLIFIRPSTILGLLPHVEQDGYVCYTDDNIVIDNTRPFDVIEDALGLAILTIKKGINKDNFGDFIEEIKDYWIRNEKLSDSSTILSQIIASDEVKKIRWSHLKFGSKKRILIGENDESVNNLCTRFCKTSRLLTTIKSAIYIPISDGASILPKSYSEFWTISEFEEILKQQLTDKQKTDLNQIIGRWKKVNKSEFLILGVYSKSGVQFLGLEFCNIKSKNHPLFSESSSIIKPINLINTEKEILIARNGENSIQDKRILVIGCGSIGSRIAPELMSIGIEKLTIIDDDFLYFENIYRHQLGIESTYKNKAKALGLMLESRFPHGKLMVYESKIENLLINETIKLNEFDLIISATGDNNVNFVLNEFLLKLTNAPPIIYSWNEPYGIGGHNLLIINQKEGCYRCLFNDLVNRASFCESGQSFIKKVAGCSSGFVPFSSLDSLKTTLGCLEIVNDVFRSGLKKNVLRSWKGDKKEFINAGYKLSVRYSLTNNDKEEVEFFKNLKCPICV